MRYPVISARESHLQPKYTRFARFMEHHETVMDRLFDDHFTGAVGPHVYHYTSVDAALGIISSEEFWASEVSCVNDPDEIRFGLNVLDEFVGEMQRRFPVSTVDVSDEIQAVRSLFSGFVRSEWKRPQGRGAAKSFVVSFSGDFDSKYQWDQYAEDESGVCIALARHTIVRSVNVFGGVVKTGVVTYSKDDVRRVFRALFDGCIAFIEEQIVIGAFEFDLIMEWASKKFYENALAHIALLKDHPYGQEKEWRIWIVPEYGYPEIAEREAAGRSVEFVHYSCESNLTQGMTHYLPVIAVIKGDQISNEDEARLVGFLKGDPHLQHVGVCTKEQWRQSLQSKV